MSVYVDNARHAYGRMIMCHMWADNLDELLKMADAIGVDRRWLQQPPKASWAHFDVSIAKKMAAIGRGAVLTDRYGPVEHVAGLDLASGNPARKWRGAKMLAIVQRRREARS